VAAVILVVGHFGTLYSYATVAGRVAEALLREGLLGGAASLDSPEAPWHPRWRHLASVYQTKPITHVLVFSAPEHYIEPFIGRFGRERSAIFVSPNTYEMAPEHVETISKFGLAIAPSQFCLNSMLNSLRELPAPSFCSVLPIGCTAVGSTTSFVERSRRLDQPGLAVHFTSDQAWPSRKGTDTLLKAWAIHHPDGARLKVHGPPALQRDALYLIADLGIDDSVEYVVSPRLGTADDELSKLYDEADLIIAPSRAEGFGMMISGAIAAGVPLLTTCNTGHAEFLVEKPGCWLTIPTPTDGQMAFEWGEAPELPAAGVLAPLLGLALAPQTRDWMLRSLGQQADEKWGTWERALPLWVERLRDWMEDT